MLDKIKQIHNWGLSVSYFGLNNYTLVLMPIILIGVIIYFFLGNKRTGSKIKRK